MEGLKQESNTNMHPVLSYKFVENGAKKDGKEQEEKITNFIIIHLKQEKINQSKCKKLFRIQKRAIRIMMELKEKNSCRSSFKEMEILPVCSQYIYSLMQYVINNSHLFKRNT
jgi:hypothetical protein